MGNSDSILNLIHSLGYWRICLRPPNFQKARLRDKDHCQSVVYQAAVSTEGGWQYPVVNYPPYESGPDWVSGSANISTYIEYWRFYQSGQFIHHLALREDHMGRLALFNPQVFIPGEGKQYLGITSSICMITDIIEFAARLSYNQILTPRAVIKIEMHSMAGRELTYMTPGRRLPKSHWFRDEVIHLEHTYSSEQLVGQARDIAIDLSIELFTKADWIAPRSLVEEDQRRYTITRS